MKRLVIKGPRQAYFEDVPIPECPDDGLLVRAVVTAISTGTELRVYRWIPVDEEGKFLHAGMVFPDEPVENGYSMVGRVVEVGRNVTGFAEGDRVFLGRLTKIDMARSRVEFELNRGGIWGRHTLTVGAGAR